MTDRDGRAPDVAGLGEYLRTRHLAMSVTVLAREFALTEVYVAGVVGELRRRGQLATTVLPPLLDLPPAPAVARIPSEQSRIARLDAYLRLPPARGDSRQRLAVRFNLSQVIVRDHALEAGWRLPEHSRRAASTEEHRSELIATIMDAHRNGLPAKKIIRRLGLPPNVVDVITSSACPWTRGNDP